MTPIPFEAISKILGEVMEKAVHNGADSRSMPDEYVAVAHFLAYRQEYIPNYQPIGYVVKHDAGGGNFFAETKNYEGMSARYKHNCQKVYVPMLDNDPRLYRWCENASTNHSSEDHVFASRVNSESQASKLMLRTKT